MTARRRDGTRVTVEPSLDTLRLLYSDAPLGRRQRVADDLGPLRQTFTRFVEAEERLDPLPPGELSSMFDACIDPARSSDELLGILRALAPGNGRVGYRQVNALVDRMRDRVDGFRAKGGNALDLVPHDHAFGSGGDFCKTTHATTGACIIAAPILPICKTGTTNVTSAHGSLQITRQLGCVEATPSAAQLNMLLSSFGFAFVGLQSLGVPYVQPLRVARRRLWNEGVARLTAVAGSRASRRDRSYAVRTTSVPLDIFKIVSPNAQVLRPTHHSTGVCHASMLPYVLGVYLHLGSQGMIVHGYDGIDELSTASWDRTDLRPNNVVLDVGQAGATVAEVGPEDLGLPRSDLAGLAEEHTVRDGSQSLRDIVAGRVRGPKRDFLVANAAVLLAAGGAVTGTGTGLVDRLRAGARLAEDLVDSGAAQDNFSRLVSALGADG